MTIDPFVYLGVLFICVVIGMKFGPKFVNWAIMCAYNQEWSNDYIEKLNGKPVDIKKTKGGKKK